MRIGDLVQVSYKTKMIADSFGDSTMPPSGYCGEIGVIDDTGINNYDWAVVFYNSEFSTDSDSVLFMERELEPCVE